MAFSYSYQDPKDFNQGPTLLEPGACIFTISGYDDNQVSRAGNDMLKLELQVRDSKGRSGKINDYIVGNAPWKLHSLLESIGLATMYGPSGRMDVSRLKGATGSCTVKTEIYTDKEGREIVSSKIDKYTTDYAMANQQRRPSEPEFNDDLPF